MNYPSRLWLVALTKLGASQNLIRCLRHNGKDRNEDAKEYKEDADQFEDSSVEMAENKLLSLLMSRFASFSAGSRLMDELEGKGVVDKETSFRSVNKVFKLLLGVCSDEALNILADVESKMEDSEVSIGVIMSELTKSDLSGALAILQNLQKQLIGRAAVFLRYTAKDRETMRTTGASDPVVGFGKGSAGNKQTHQLALRTFVGYAEELLRQAQKIIIRATSVAQKSLQCDALGLLGVALLEYTFIGRLTQPLLAALPMFAVPENQILALRALPELTKLAEAIDKLTVMVGRTPGAHSLMPIPKRLEFESHHPYRKGYDRKFRIRIKGAKQLMVEFDRRCATAGKLDSLQMIDKAQNPIHGIMQGAAGRDSKSNSEWPREPIAVKGDMIYVTFKTAPPRKNDNIPLEQTFGYKFTVIGAAMEKPMHWLSEFNFMTLHSAGTLVKTAIHGPMPSIKEIMMKDLLTEPAIQGGLLRTQPRYKELSARLSATIVSPSDRRIVENVFSNSDSLTEKETKMLYELENSTKVGIKFFDKVSKNLARTERVRPQTLSKNVKPYAVRLALRYFALLLRHTLRTREAVNIFDSPSVKPSPLFLHLLANAHRVQRDCRTHYGDTKGAKQDKIAAMQHFEERFNRSYIFLLNSAPHPKLCRKEEEKKEAKLSSDFNSKESLVVKVLDSIRKFFTHEIKKEQIDMLMATMMVQRERAVGRLLGLKRWRDLLSVNDSLGLELVCKPAADALVVISARGVLTKQHLLEGVSCSGRKIVNDIFDTYYDQVIKRLFLVERSARQMQDVSKRTSLTMFRRTPIARLAEMIVQKQLAEQRRVEYGVRAVVTDLCSQNYQMYPSDLGGLFRAGVVGFIGQALHEILLSFAGKDASLQQYVAEHSTVDFKTNGGNGGMDVVLRRRPMHNLYGVFSLFRLLLSVSAKYSADDRSIGSDDDEGKKDAKLLLKSLISMLMTHLSALNHFRVSSIGFDEELDELDEEQAKQEAEKEDEDDENTEEVTHPMAVTFWKPDLLDPENVNEKVTSMSFSHQSDFDENGIIYFLASIRGKWHNPAVKIRRQGAPLIKLSASSLKSDPKSLSLLCGRSAGRLLTTNEQNAWFQLYFGKNKRIVPNAYTLRHYSSYHQECLRNWKLMGSNDGEEWITIKEHVDDDSLQGKGGTATWPVQVSPAHQHGWSHFRVQITGPNSSGA